MEFSLLFYVEIKLCAVFILEYVVVYFFIITISYSNW